MAEQKQRYKLYVWSIACDLAIVDELLGVTTTFCDHHGDARKKSMVDLVAMANSASSIAEERDDAIEALKEYVKWFGPAHDQDCPGDDTCECSGANVNRLVNVALRNAAHAALSEEGK